MKVPPRFRPLCVLLAALLSVTHAGAQGTERNRLFPTELYQGLDAPWLEGAGEERLFSAAFQRDRAAEFRRRFLEPWDPAFPVATRGAEADALQAKVLENLRKDLPNRSGFGPNLRPYGPAWLDRIAARLAPPAPGPRPFLHRNRAVILENTPVRLLPTLELYMQDPELPGQGYPFDNLQNSVLWAGTPVYILDATRNQDWYRVLAPDCAGWVRAQALARAGSRFVRQWRRVVLRNGLTAALATETPVRGADGRFRFHAFVGNVFPRVSGAGGILIPERNGTTHLAVSRRARLPEDAAAPQPWPYTPRNAARLWSTLLGRPYGWGNARLDNDCSAEMKCFFTPFGLWLPRHSTDQKDMGRSVDLSALGVSKRLAALARIGKPYCSLVWIPGHVMLYLGPVDYLAPDGARATGFMSYQNLWGLRPKAPPDFRAIVGGSVLFPVLDMYPQHPELSSLADKGRFVVTQLDQVPEPDSR